jgi:hypothetical protein
MTAAITWAVLATVGAVAVYWLMRREVQDLATKIAVASEQWAYELNRVTDERNKVCDEVEDLAFRLFVHKLDAAKAARRRHLSAKHARAAQLAAKRLQVVGKAAEINREMGR